MPDDMDTNYAQEYPHQPVQTVIHTCTQVNSCCCASSVKTAGKHPFHEHGNHVPPSWARDGNLILSQTDFDEACWTVALHHDYPPPRAWQWTESYLLLDW